MVVPVRDGGVEHRPELLVLTHLGVEALQQARQGDFDLGGVERVHGRCLNDASEMHLFPSPKTCNYYIGFT